MARRVAEALERCTSAPAATSASRWAVRPCGSRSVPTRLTMTGIRRSARAAAMAGASRADGSGSAPWPSTRSIRITPVPGSAAARASCSLRRVGSIIGCARPWVRASSPKSTIVWASASRSSAGSARSSESGMLLRIGAEGGARHQHRLVAERAADEEAAEQGTGRRAGVVGAGDGPLGSGVARAGRGPLRPRRSGRAGRGRAVRARRVCPDVRCRRSAPRRPRVRAAWRPRR